MDFLRESLVPLVLGSHMGSILTENEAGKIYGAGPHEIEAPVTSGLSQGTKIFVSKIFSYHPLTMLFSSFCRFIWQKMMKIKKNLSILAYLAINHRCRLVL